MILNVQSEKKHQKHQSKQNSRVFQQELPENVASGTSINSIKISITIQVLFNYLMAVYNQEQASKSNSNVLQTRKLMTMYGQEEHQQHQSKQNSKVLEEDLGGTVQS